MAGNRNSGMRNRNALYMAVTPDEYELPIAVADTLDDLAQMRKRPKSRIKEAIARSRSGEIIGEKYIRVDYPYPITQEVPD